MKFRFCLTPKASVAVPVVKKRVAKKADKKANKQASAKNAETTPTPETSAPKTPAAGGAESDAPVASA